MEVVVVPGEVLRLFQLVFEAGNRFYESERHEEALVAFEVAIRLDPEDAEAHNNKGNALFELGRHDEALAAYEEAIRLDPDDADFYDNKGNALSELERHEEALAAHNEALRLSRGCRLSLQ